MFTPEFLNMTALSYTIMGYMIAFEKSQAWMDDWKSFCVR